jgi:hypothetical protein
MSAPNARLQVPELLKSLPNWVQWKLTANENGVIGKVPFVAGTNFSKNAASTRSSTWKTFEEATCNITLTPTQGVGFVVHGDATKANIVGFDIDGCRNPNTGDITPWAEELINLLDSYTEVTPSQTGVRVWVVGKAPSAEHVFNLDPSAGYGDKVKIEVYNSGRYFTVTGDSYYEEAVEIEKRELTSAYELCRSFTAKYPTKNKTAESAAPTDNASASAPVEGAKVKQTGTVITDKLELLMRGTIESEKPFVITDGMGNSIDEYPTQSEADMGLCTLLALKHGDQPDLIWNEYVTSSLYREKWGAREADFRRLTIAKAIRTAGRMKAESAETEPPKSGANELKTETKTEGVVTPLVSVDGDEFMVENIPPRRILLRTITKKEPVFFGQSINQIFAWRGVGKTNVGLGLTMAFATGGSFLNWEVTERARVLYVEGEMPQSQLQERWNQIVGKTGGYARLITIDKQPSNIMPKLSTQIGMDKVEATLTALAAEGFKVTVLMLDSISTLFNVKANDEDTWLTIQDWLISLRSRGLTIFYFHHAGKSGASRSHSKSEDMLDVSINLERPKDREAGILHAIMSYDKARAGPDEPSAEIKMRRTHSDKCFCKGKGLVIGCRGDGVAWEYLPTEDAKKCSAFNMFNEGSSLNEVAREVGIARSTAQRWKEKWEEARGGGDASVSKGLERCTDGVGTVIGTADVKSID